MSETRRQVFKTSVLAAFGLMSCATNVKPTTVRSHPTPQPSSFTTDIAVNDEHLGWVLLEYQPVGGNYRAYYSPGGWSDSSGRPDIGKITASSSPSQSVPPRTTLYVADSAGAEHTLLVDENSLVQGSALSYLVSHDGLAHTTWNEIGRQ
jgi:hypothetical protein